MQRAVGVLEAQREEVGERLPFGGGAEDFVAPFVRVVHVEVGGGDVVVADDDESGVFALQVVNVAGDGVQPVQFVGVFFVADRFAVGDVEVQYAHVADVCRDGARLFVGITRYAAHHVGQWLARDEGDAVVGLLAVGGDVVAGGFYGGGVHGGVGLFEFLQAEDVGRGFLQVLQDVRQADVERVYVPTGDVHGAVFRVSIFVSSGRMFALNHGFRAFSIRSFYA